MSDVTILERRHRHGGAAARLGGTGLGLVLSKQLSDMMGGTMWVESEPGEGSASHFTALMGDGPRSCPDRRLPGEEAAPRRAA